MKKFARIAAATTLACLLAPSAFAGLFGPTKNLLRGDQLTDKLATQPVVFISAGSSLQTQTKGAAIGAFLLSTVLSSAMASGGGGGAMNAQQMQNNMQANANIAQSFSQGLTPVLNQAAAKMASKPSGQVAKDGPVAVISQQLIASLSAESKFKLATEATAPTPTDLQFKVEQILWKLDFSMMSSDYSLLYQTDVSVYQKSSDTLFFTDSCKGESPKKMPLETWQQNDFAAVADAATALGKVCAEQFVKNLGFKTVLAAPAASVPTDPAAAPVIAASEQKPQPKDAVAATTEASISPAAEATAPAVQAVAPAAPEAKEAKDAPK